MKTDQLPFLQQIARYILDNFTGNTRDCCVVLPNRRAGLFLKKYLGELTDKPLWSPQIFSVEDFVFQVSGLQKADGIRVQFELYKIYQEIEGSNASGFDAFVGWAEVVLQDFNDIDLYLAEPEKVFAHISEARALATWNLGEKPLTTFEKNYIRFYQSLNTFYQKLVHQLLLRKMAYQGLAYRMAAKELGSQTKEFPWTKVLFVGFNALSFAEETIIRQLMDEGKAEVFWDADSYYLDDPIQEAGRFLRQNKKRFNGKGFDWVSDQLGKGTKNVHLIGVPKNIGQAKVAGDLLRKLAGHWGQPDETALVLNDESLLQALLNSLPPEIDALNITMGMTLSKTPLFTLINQFTRMNENAVKFQRSDQALPLFYYKDVIRFFEHPFLQAFLTGDKTSMGLTAGKSIQKLGKVFIGVDDILAIDYFSKHPQKEKIAAIMEPSGRSPQNSILQIRELLSLLKYVFSTGDGKGKPSRQNAISLEYVYYFSQVFNRLHALFQEFEFLNDPASFRYLFTQLIRQEVIPFYGEPLHGIQMMGMLETRNLDFKNVILLSVNEGFIPVGKSIQSFIPLDIRNAYHLPSYHERNAVFAYHFYRLMQRSENIYLVYNTEAGDLGGGDKSRFISQIEHELAESNPSLTIHRQILSSPVSTIPSVLPISVTKSESILEKIKELSERGFSASALNVYRNCSLQYYLQYIARIDEMDEVEETVEANTLGTVVHEAMQKLYTPHLQKNLLAADLGAMQKKVAEEIQKAFAAHFASSSIRYGKNHLIAKVAESMVDNFIKIEKAGLTDNRAGELQVQALEQKMSASLEVSTSMGLMKVGLKGFIDRLDLRDGKLRIIDYKTGRVEARELKLAEWPLLLRGEGHAKTFQLLFYGMLYFLDTGKLSRDVQPGIISFRNMKAGFMPVSFPENEDFETAMSTFREVLLQLIAEIFDPSIKFEQTELVKNCEYCSYKNICRR